MQYLTGEYVSLQQDQFSPNIHAYKVFPMKTVFSPAATWDTALGLVVETDYIIFVIVGLTF